MKLIAPTAADAEAVGYRTVAVGSNMADKLAGCFIKLDRAQTHISSLRTEIRDFFGHKPDILPGEADLETGDCVFRAQRTIEIPLRWSAVVGDVVHNLNAALNYLVWELISSNGGVGTTGSSFPIFRTRQKYQKDSRRMISGVNPDAMAVFERLQPFHLVEQVQEQVQLSQPEEEPCPSQYLVRNDEPIGHPLWALYEMGRRDRHQTLNLTSHTLKVKFHSRLSSGLLPSHPFSFLPGTQRSG
jgi:hypothetical protein